MPIRRSVVAVLATTIAFGLALVPVTADAAQVQNCLNVQVPTAATKPWYDFNHSVNRVTGDEKIIDTVAAQLPSAVATLTAASSPTDISAAKSKVTAITSQLQSIYYDTLLTAQLSQSTLIGGLTAVGTSSDVSDASALLATAGAPFNTAFDNLSDAVDAWLNPITTQLNASPFVAPVNIGSAAATRSATTAVATALDTYLATGSNKVVLQTVNQCSILTVPDITINSVTSKFGKSATLSTSVSLSGAPQSGTLTVLIDGRPHTTPQTTGTTTIALPAALSVGKHFVTVAFNSTQGAGPSVATGIVTVKKGTASTAVKLSKSSVKKGKSAKVTFTVSSPGASVTPTGKVSLYLNGKKSVSKSLKNGKVTFSLKTGKTGTLKVRGKYAGSASYIADASTTKNLKIK